MSRLLKPGQSPLEEKVEHLEMTLAQMQNDVAMAHMVLQTHGSLFEMLRRYFKKVDEFQAKANSGNAGSGKSDQPDGQSKPPASTSGEGK